VATEHSDSDGEKCIPAVDPPQGQAPSSTRTARVEALSYGVQPAKKPPGQHFTPAGIQATSCPHLTTWALSGAHERETSGWPPKPGWDACGGDEG